MRRNRCRRGIAAVWIVLICVFLVGMIGLAVDAAYIFFTGQQLQDAADAAALAGAQKICWGTLDQARALAQTTAASNWAANTPVLLSLNEENAAAGDIVIGRFRRSSQTFKPTLTGANAIKVMASRPDLGSGRLGLFFGPLFGLADVGLTRGAIAMTIDGNGAAILCLNPTAPRALNIHGSLSVIVTDGAIHVNSTDPDAAVFGGGTGVELDVSDINIGCDYPEGYSPIDDSINFDGNLNDAAPYQEDPLLFLQDHVPPAGTPLASPSGNATADITIDPGYYPDGIKWNSGTLRLNPGVYAFEGDGLQITGGNFIAGDFSQGPPDGVLIYVNGGKKAKIKLTGNGITKIAPMTSGPYAGVSLWQDVNCTNDAVINGTDQMSLGGTLYLPGAHLTLTGTAESYGNQVIANTVEIGGSSFIRIDYDGRFPLKGKVFLVR